MKKLLILILYIGIVQLAQAQTNWVKVNADQHLSVNFPVVPKEVMKGTYSGITRDSSIIFICSMVDLQTVGLDSASLASEKDTPAFVSDFTKGIVSKMPYVNFGNFKIGRWNSITNYTGTGTDSKGRLYDMFILLQGSRLYTVSTITTSKADLKIKSDYLASLAYKP